MEAKPKFSQISNSSLEVRPKLSQISNSSEEAKAKLDRISKSFLVQRRLSLNSLRFQIHLWSKAKHKLAQISN